jgi:hypothetical protein
VNREEVMRAVRQPASAAIAGLVFSGILITVILLFHSAAPALVEDSSQWVDDPSRRQAVERALNLIPFAGIAFLWFIAVIRAQLGSREDRFFETVFLGSGLLFVAMLFTAAAALKGILALTAAGVTLPEDSLAFAWTFSGALLGSFGARMAAVFTLSVATMGIRTGTIPRWLAFLGYATGLLLMLTPPLPNLTQFLFPAWVLALSVLILVRRRAM